MEAHRQQNWHHQSSEKVVNLLDSDKQHGLTEAELSKRQADYGPNTIPGHSGPGPLLRFLLQFHQPLLYILMVASVITAIMDEWVDAAVIMAVVLVNAIIGFLQEAKAAKALDALAKTTVTEARVVRDGETHLVPSAELVPGDIVLLKSGAKVPADLRLLHLRDLQVDESALTGESMPVEKKVDALEQDVDLAQRTNMSYASTLVTYGEGRGIVVAIGRETEVGRISDLISTADVLQTPLTRKINKFSHLLLIAILVLGAITFAVGVARGQGKFEMFMAAVALAVGAIPEGLPAAVTITLAIGVARMARRKAIIRKLPAVETLGGTSVICSDKTGTLTVNQMTVRRLWAAGHTYAASGAGYEPSGQIEKIQNSSDNGDSTESDRADAKIADNQAAAQAILTGVLCNDSQLVQQESRWSVEGNPTEGALLAVANKASFDYKQLSRDWPRLDSIPFESERQYMATLHHQADDESTKHLFVKGAVEVILKHCSSAIDSSGETSSFNRDTFNRDTVQQQVAALASQGLRVLAFAGKSMPASQHEVSHEDISDLTFYGLQGMIDPPRDEALKAIKACRTAGIRVKMITGDHALTAKAIAEQLGLASSGDQQQETLEVMTAKDLAKTSDEDLVEIANRVNVFARATPELKLRLVRALQKNGQVVSMTGDGVNDGPALKQADIGIAMGITGTEVSKEAADMVLTDDNFASIEAAVEEGRGVFDNLTKFIVWTLPTNMGEALVILAAVFIGAQLPILPVQILWINMTTAVLLGLMLAFEPKEPDIMLRSPRDPDAPILSSTLITRILLVSVIMLIGAFGAFRWALNQGYSDELARTIAVNVFVMVELCYLFNCRSLTKTMFEIGLFSNRWIGVGVTAMIVLQLGFTYLPFMNKIFHSVPIGWDAWWRILLTGLATYLIVGFEKWIRRRLAG